MRQWVLLPMIFMIIVIAGLVVDGRNIGQSSRNRLRRFSSHEELMSFLETNLNRSGDRHLEGGFPVPRAPSPLLVGEVRDSDHAIDFSKTNIQIEGVDEADIVKSDGKHIHVVSGNKIFIIDAYPAENAKLLSVIKENGHPIELFINGDKLVVVGLSFVRIYDVSDREKPALARDISFNGHYFKSRMIDNFVYAIINSPLIRTYTWERSEAFWMDAAHRTRRMKLEITLPEIVIDGRVRTIQANEIYYLDVLDSYNFTTIMAINVQDNREEVKTKTILTGTANNIFVSSNNIYVTHTSYDEMEKTVIHKIAIAGGEIKCTSRGEVPGRVLNQFSMDEYRGYFRIATTTGWRGANHVYVLDEDLNIIGRLEGLAPGERIYSARFMGTRVYLVTFKIVDPLFVIDLVDPANPKVLGELKIPGYSDYLHPYDENHLIGVGKDAIESECGNFAWFQGVKLALFDVSDPRNPREMFKYVIGERGTDSYASYDHRAFLFSRSKNLLVIPISLVKDGGDFWWRKPDWRGVYVFDVSLDNGFVLKGGITHYGGGGEIWSSYSDRSVKRSLFIDNVLYTISGELVKMNSLKDLSEINSVKLELPQQTPLQASSGDIIPNPRDNGKLILTLGKSMELLSHI